MSTMKAFLIFFSIILLSESAFAQTKNNGFDHMILGSFHLANYFDGGEFNDYKSCLGLGVEYRIIST